MRLRLVSRIHTEGFVTAETAICCCSVILIFAIFISIAGYCRTYQRIKEFIYEKAQDYSLTGYQLGFDVPGIVMADDLEGVGDARIRGLLVYSESWGEEVRLNASYTYVSPVGGIRVRMSEFFTKWAGDSPADISTVWELPPAERGKVIESIFGGGLPEFFPVIDAYDMISGHAALIVSIDTTLERYCDGSELKKVIIQKTDELSDFRHGEYEDVMITDKDIDTREIIIVIPENELNEMQAAALEECIGYSALNSITCTVKRYQKAGK